MPQVFDNIDRLLLPMLQSTLGFSGRADFCVGYFQSAGLQAAGKPADLLHETRTRMFAA